MDCGSALSALCAKLFCAMLAQTKQTKRQHCVGYFPAKICLCAQGQYCTSNFLLQCCFRRIWTTLCRPIKYWAIPEKKQTGQVEDMEFPGYQKNSMWNFQGLIKNEMKFPGVTKKKSCRFSRGLGFGPWNFQGITQLCRISRDGAFVLSGISRGKIPKNSRGFFKKACPQPPVWFFSGTAHSHSYSLRKVVC